MEVARLESLFTADLGPYEKGAKDFEARNKKLDGTTVTAKVDLDTKAGDSKREKFEDRVRNSDTTIPIDANTDRARDELGRFTKHAEEAGAEGGDRGGKALVTGIVAGLATIPIVGAVAKIGEAAGNAVAEGFQSGLAVEVRADRLAATTNLDPEAVSRLARASGEAYADNFGESIEANMDAARRAVQSGLLDPKATQRDAQDVISSLSGVADIVEEDVSRVSRSTTQLLKTGLAKNAQEAFDIIVAGQQAGLNVSEDWLDTLDEYSTQWRKLGLEGGDVLGLLQQGVQAGARDTDIVADSLKELSIRAIDGSTLTVQGFEAIGLSAEDMGSRFAAGGKSAREALGDTLDGLREIEDPAKRDAAAVALLGTQAEDLGKALYAMDLDTAAKEFEDLEGRSSRALSTLGDNAAGDLETAKRNVEVGVTAIQGALAGAFSDDIEAGAEFVAENREAVVGFLLEAANAALDFGRSAVEGAAAGTEGFGDFVGQTGPAVLGLIGSIIDGIDSIPFVDLGDAADDFAKIREEAEASFAEFDSGSEVAADSIRRNIIENGLDPAQAKLNEFGETALIDARLSDATKQLGNDIADVGYAADGSKLALDDYDGSLDTSSKSGAQLDKQIRGVKSALEGQVGAAYAAGESQESLRGRVNSARAAFIDQMTALGLTKGEARKLADAYGLVPDKVVTTVTDNGSAARVKQGIDNIPSSKTVTITTIQQVWGGTPTGTGTVLRRAGGGSVVGPGTGTSDSVLVAASNGEHVWTADEVQQAGGHGAMYRLRSAVRAGLAKFRDGGAIGAADRSADYWADETARWRRLARIRRTEAGRNSAEEQADKAAQRAREAQARATTLRQEAADFTRQVRRGEVGGDQSTVDQLIASSRDENITRGGRRHLSRMAGISERVLGTLDRASRRIADNLEDARDRVSELGEISNRVSTGLVGEFSLTDASGPQARTNARGDTDAVTPSARGIVGAVRASASRILGFGKKLKALAAAGLKGRALDEIAELGSVQGSAVADEFLSDRSQIGALNSAYGALDAAGTFAGQSVTEGYYKGGLAQAEGYAKGLERQQAILDRQYDRQGQIMARAMANALGIKARASGGPVTAGNPYLVNENTPNSELFVPGVSGTILNRSQMAALGGGGPAVAIFTDSQVAILARAIRDGAASGLAGHEAAQDRASRYARGF